MSLIAELKRRNVFRMAIAYLIVAWLVLQVGDVLGPALRLPEWVNSLLLFFLLLGFPLALLLAWAFELTPDGLKPESGEQQERPGSGAIERRFNYTILALLLCAALYFFWESRIADAPPETASNADAVADSVKSPGAAPATEAAGTSVGVLPFVNVSPDQAQDYLSDGLTEEVINALVKIRGMSVPARTSVFAFKGQAVDVRDVGLTLGVAYVLEGSIRSQGDAIRVTANLTSVSNGFQIWSERYDRKLEDIFQVQEDIATAIAERLQVELGGVEAVPNRTSDMLAYDNYLRGRAALRYRNDTAIELLKAATRADPEFAPAWAALAIAYQARKSPTEAVEAAERALDLDPQNVDALTAMGSLLRQMQRWEDSERYFNRAFEIDPDSAELLEDYAELLNFTGQSGTALEVSERGMAIDPLLQPLVAAYAEALLSNGEGNAAREAVLRSLEQSGNLTGLWWASLPLWLTPSEDGRIPVLAQTAGPDSGEAMLRDLLASPDPATISQLKSVLDPDQEPASDLNIGRRNARLLLLYFGEVDFVINKDIANPTFFPSENREWLWTPLFSDYRRHPQFARFLREVGLIDYWDRSRWPDWCQRDAQGVVTCR